MAGLQCRGGEGFAEIGPLYPLPFGARTPRLPTLSSRLGAFFSQSYELVPFPFFAAFGLARDALCTSQNVGMGESRCLMKAALVSMHLRETSVFFARLNLKFFLLAIRFSMPA